MLLDQLRAPVNSNGFSPRAIVTYKLTNDMLFDAQGLAWLPLGASTIRSTYPCARPPDIQVFGGHPTWQDQKAWNTEVGAKTQFLDRKVTFNARPSGRRSITCRRHHRWPVFLADLFNVPTPTAPALRPSCLRGDANWDLGLSATWVNAVLTSTVTTKDNCRQYDSRWRVAGWQPAADRAEVAGVASIGYTQPLQSGRICSAFSRCQYVRSFLFPVRSEAAACSRAGDRCKLRRGFGKAGASCNAATTIVLPAVFLGRDRRGEHTHSPRSPERSKSSSRSAPRKPAWLLSSCCGGGYG